MKIEFTKHAKIRCIQRRIPESWVEERLREIPLKDGEHRKRLDGTNLIVIFKDGNENRIVITLFAASEKDSVQGAWKQVQKRDVQTMQAQAFEKVLKRNKKDKKMKDWNR